jgi:TonB family protein
MLSHNFTRTATTALIALLFTAAGLLTTMTSRAAELPASESASVKNVASASLSCHAQLVTIRTNFAKDLQARGEHGDVTLKVLIGKDGRAVSVETAQSSGYRSLDRAAAESVSENWRFDVSHCAPNQLPIDATATIKFERAPQATVSGTVNRHRARLAADPATATRCDAADDDSGDTVLACVTDASLLARNKEQSLANRIDTNVETKQHE